MGGAARQAAMEAKAEKERREEEKRAFKEAQELDALRRTFKRIIKSGDNKISADDITSELRFLGYAVTEKEAALFVWEVDDDNDGHVDWDEFRTMFYRVRDDQSGCEPRRLFNVVDFLMLDKNHSGAVRLPSSPPRVGVGARARASSAPTSALYWRTFSCVLTFRFFVVPLRTLRWTWTSASRCCGRDTARSWWRRTCKT